MAARMIVQLLRMLRTPECEIADLLTSSSAREEASSELVRLLCMLQLDIVADMATATADVLAGYREQVMQLWQSHLAEGLKGANEVQKKTVTKKEKLAGSSSSSLRESNCYSKPLIDFDEDKCASKTLLGKEEVSVVMAKDEEEDFDDYYDDCCSKENVLSMKTINLLYNLFRKLTVPEVIVDSLLDKNTRRLLLFNGSACGAADQTPVKLFARLLAIEEMVSKVPDNAAASVTTSSILAAYREEVIALWTGNYCLPGMKEPTANKGSTSSSSVPLFITTNANMSNNKMGHSTLANAAKANTCALIERTFARIGPITIKASSSAHLDQLKDVVNCVTKAIKQSRQFVRDEAVQARAVGAILPKLPESMQAAFAERCERHIDEPNLRHLKLFISSEIGVMRSALGVAKEGVQQL